MLKKIITAVAMLAIPPPRNSAGHGLSRRRWRLLDPRRDARPLVLGVDSATRPVLASRGGPHLYSQPNLSAVLWSSVIIDAP
jgi:hypothetical protein